MRDTPRPNDLVTALMLLTRWPLPAPLTEALPPDPARGAAAAWAWPVVGALVGAVAATAGWLALVLGASPGIAAAVMLAAMALSTGAMHEDGLADCADGLGGGATRDRRLAIMRDSRIGAFGTVALVLALVARWSALSMLAAAGSLFWPLVVAAAAARLPMVLVAGLMPPARSDGLSVATGRPPARAMGLAAGLVAVAGLVILGWGAVPLLFWVLVAPVPLIGLAARRLGGQTGDVLGGVEQLAEIAALAVVAALVAG